MIFASAYWLTIVLSLHFGGRHGHYAKEPFILGGNQKKCTVPDVGIQLFRLFTKRPTRKIRGMLAGVMFRPISFKTVLGLEAQYPYGPYSTLKYGRNPIFAKVMGLLDIPPPPTNWLFDY